MKSILLGMALFAGFSAQALEVRFKCSPKAYGCGPNGCAWTRLYEGAVTYLPIYRTVSDPNIWFGRYQTILDGHQLTLDFTHDERHPERPPFVHAYLGATTVMGETSGINRIDISLRDNSFGRGFVCSQIRLRQ